MLQGEVLQLYSSIYDEFTLAKYDEKTQVHPQLFDVIDHSSKDYYADDLSTLGRWTDTDEDEAGAEHEPVQGYPVTITPAKKTQVFWVSFEAVDQDEYALLNKTGEAESMGLGLRATVEAACGKILWNGFNDTGPDSTYIFANQHPKNREEATTYYDNLLDGAFSHDALETAEAQIAANFYSPAGISIKPPEKPILVYPPALNGPVLRVLSERAGDQPGTTLRNINIYSGDYSPLEWQYVSAKEGGSNTAWYIVYPSIKGLKLVWQVRPKYMNWVTYNPERYYFKGRAIFLAKASNWRCGFASTGQ